MGVVKALLEQIVQRNHLARICKGGFLSTLMIAQNPLEGGLCGGIFGEIYSSKSYLATLILSHTCDSAVARVEKLVGRPTSKSDLACETVKGNECAHS